MENFALIFTALALGFILQKTQTFPKEAPLILNQFILYISLPAMALLEIPRLHFSQEVLIPVAVAWTVMGASALLILLVSKYFAFDKKTKGALLLVGVLGNTSFLGIPIIEAYFGQKALGYVLMYDQLGTFIALCSYGTIVAVYYSSTQTLNTAAIVRRIFTFPPFLALLLALFFIQTPFPPVLVSVLGSLSSTIVPLALVAVGLQLQFRLAKSELKPFVVALLSTLIFAPLAALTLALIFAAPSLAWSVSVMEASMGPMITAGVLASMSGLAPRLSTAIVGYGTLLSFTTSFFFYQLHTLFT